MKKFCLFILVFCVLSPVVTAQNQPVFKLENRKFGKGVISPSLSPDGKGLLFLTKTKTNWKLWLDRGKTKLLLVCPIGFPAPQYLKAPWSFDGSQILFGHPKKKGVFQIYSVKTGKWAEVKTPFASLPLWWANDLVGQSGKAIVLVDLKTQKATPLKIQGKGPVEFLAAGGDRLFFVRAKKVYLFHKKTAKLTVAFALARGASRIQMVLLPKSYICLYQISSGSVVVGDGKTLLKGLSISAIGLWKNQLILSARVWNPEKFSFQNWCFLGDPTLKNFTFLQAQANLLSSTTQGHVFLSTPQGFSLAKIVLTAQAHKDNRMNFYMSCWVGNKLQVTYKRLVQIGQAFLLYWENYAKLPQKKIISSLMKFDGSLPRKDGFSKAFSFRAGEVLSSLHKGYQIGLQMDKNQGKISFFGSTPVIPRIAFSEKVLVPSKRTQASILILRAQKALKDNQYDKATKLATQSKKLYGKNPAATKILTMTPLLKQARKALNAQDLKNAQALAQKALTIYKSSVSANFILRRVADIKKSQALTGQAQKSLKQKNYLEAKQLAQEALQLNSKNKKAGQIKGQAEGLEKQVASLLVKAKKAFAEFEVDQCDEFLAKLRLLAPEKKEVKKLVSEVVQFYYGQAQQNFTDGNKDTDLATQFLNRMLKYNPKDGRALALLKKVNAHIAYAQKHKNQIAAKKELGIAQGLLKKGNDEGALSSLKKAVKLDPKNKEIQTLLAKIQKKVDTARALLAQKKIKALWKKVEALEKKPNYKELFDALEQILALQADHKQAKAKLASALEKYKGQIESAILKGEYKNATEESVLLKTRLPKDYKSILDKIATAKNKDLFVAYLAQAKKDEKAGKDQVALDLYKKALALFPKDPTALTAHKALDQKIGDKKSKALFNQAKEALEKGKYSQAKKLALQAGRLNEKLNVQALLKSAREGEEIVKALGGVQKLLARRDFPGAFRELDRLLDQYPKNKKLVKEFQQVKKQIKKIQLKKKIQTYFREAQRSFEREDFYTTRSLCQDVLSDDPKHGGAQKLLARADKKIDVLLSATQSSHLWIEVKLTFGELEKARSSKELDDLADSIVAKLNKLDDLSGANEDQAEKWQTRVAKERKRLMAYWKALGLGLDFQKKGDHQKAHQAFLKALKFYKSSLAQRLDGISQKILAQKEKMAKGQKILDKAKKAQKAKDPKKAYSLAKQAVKLLGNHKGAKDLVASLAKRLKFLHYFGGAQKASKGKKYLSALVNLEHASHYGTKGDKPGLDKIRKAIDKALPKDKALQRAKKIIKVGVEAIYKKKFAQCKKSWNLDLKMSLNGTKWTSKKEMALLKKAEFALIVAEKKKAKEKKIQTLLATARLLLAKQTDDWKKKIPQILKKIHSLSPKTKTAGLAQILDRLIKVVRAYRTAALLQGDFQRALEKAKEEKALLTKAGSPLDRVDEKIRTIKKNLFENYSQKQVLLVLSLLENGKLKEALALLRKENQKSKNSHLLLTALEEELHKVASLGGIPKGMVYVPSGAFFFGIQGEKKILPGYFIDKYEVTNRSFWKYVKKNKINLSPGFYKASGWKMGAKKKPYPLNTDLYPVSGVSYDEALGYARSRAKRLPTEEEWEKAGRGPFDQRLFSWGNVFVRSYANLERSRSSRTGAMEFRKDRSPYGCLDMTGNVSEWVDDVMFEKRGIRIQKGGNFLYSSTLPFSTLVYRYWASKNSRSKAVGFRCAMDFGMVQFYQIKKKATRLYKESIQKANRALKTLGGKASTATKALVKEGRQKANRALRFAKKAHQLLVENTKASVIRAQKFALKAVRLARGADKAAKKIQKMMAPKKVAPKKPTPKKATPKKVK